MILYDIETSNVCSKVDK